MAVQNSIQNMYLWVYLFETQKRAGAVCTPVIPALGYVEAEGSKPESWAGCSVNKALGWLLSDCSVDKATQG